MTEVDRESEVPEGWKKKTLGAVRKDYSGSIDPSQRPDQLFEHYSVPSFDSGRPTIEQGSEIGSTKKKLEEGMVLLCKINPRINRVWKVESYTEHPKIGSTEWIRFPRIDGLDPDYLRLYMSQDQFRNYLALESSGAGSSLMRVKKSVVDQYPFVLPPLPEQRRIVAKIEELFSNLNVGLNSLETAERQLESYRQSVLQAAVEGRLTADWRRAHCPDPADQLLERILEERRGRWEEDYQKKYQSKGKKPPEGWRSRYPSPERPEDSDLPDIPTGWKWAKVKQISIVYSGVTKNASKSGDLVSMPYLRVANVYANELRLDDVREIKVRRSRLYKYLLQEGDLLVVEGNGSKSQIGRVARWDGSLDPCVHQNHLIKVRPVIKECGRYLLLWMLSPAGRRHIMRVASSTSGLYTLSLTKVRNIPVPLPPLSEQRVIVDEVSRLLSIGDNLVNTLEGEEQRGERLRQSILKKAFSGRLVPTGAETNPDDASGMNGKSATQMHVDA